MAGNEPLASRCAKKLQKLWEQVQTSLVKDSKYHTLTNEEQAQVRQLLTSPTKSYHYVLPTQLLAKYTDPSLDARSLQSAYQASNSFDARTIAHRVIVPFDKDNYNVLGGSPEPYVNNPLRYPAVLPDYRNQQKNKTDWDLLVAFLDKIQKTQKKSEVRRVLTGVLVEIYHLLATVHVVYPTPNRVSLLQCQHLINEFISEVSGGERLESVVAALFIIIGNKFGLFDAINRAKINAADAQTGMTADIECLKNNNTLLAVEVKDKTLSITQFESIIESARARRISEILFVANRSVQEDQKDLLNRKLTQEFVSGQNAYIVHFDEFSSGILILLGESGRAEFLVSIGQELDRVGAPILIRRHWRDLLRSL